MSSHSSKVEPEARADAPPAVETKESADSAAGIASNRADAAVLVGSTTLPEARHASLPLAVEDEVAELRAKNESRESEAPHSFGKSGDGTLIHLRSYLHSCWWKLF